MCSNCGALHLRQGKLSDACVNKHPVRMTRLIPALLLQPVSTLNPQPLSFLPPANRPQNPTPAPPPWSQGVCSSLLQAVMCLHVGLLLLKNCKGLSCIASEFDTQTIKLPSSILKAPWRTSPTSNPPLPLLWEVFNSLRLSPPL